MNVWTDIAIGNLMRKRPPPVVEGPLFECIKCGAEKPEEGFIIKISKRANGSERADRSKKCRVCINEEDRARRPRQPKPVSIHRQVIDALQDGDKITSEIADFVGKHRRNVDKAMKELIEIGIVEPRGYVIVKYHPRITKYGLTQGGAAAGKEHA